MALKQSEEEKNRLEEELTRVNYLLNIIIIYEIMLFVCLR